MSTGVADRTPLTTFGRPLLLRRLEGPLNESAARSCDLDRPTSSSSSATDQVQPRGPGNELIYGPKALPSTFSGRNSFRPVLERRG
jgi:hypothetical protein